MSWNDEKALVYILGIFGMFSLLTLSRDVGIIFGLMTLWYAIIIFNRDKFIDAMPMTKGKVNVAKAVTLGAAGAGAFLFLSTYLAILWFWIFNTTILYFFLPSLTFAHLLCLTAALCLPDIMFMFSAFFRVPMIAVFLTFNLWKIYICYVSLGLIGTISYVLIGPFALTAACLAFAEYKFHIFKYIRRMF